MPALYRGDQIFFSATCPGQVASKNPLVLGNFLLVPNYFSNCIAFGSGCKYHYRIYPKYSDTLNIRTPSFFSEKTPILCTLYFRTRSLQGIFAVRKCSDTKNMSLISHKTSIFHYLNSLYICSVYLRFRLV